MLSEKDLSASLQAFVDGSNYRAQDVLGVHREKRAEGEGFVFRVWAPHAQQVWLVGDFNQWDEHSLPMQKDQYGVWSIFTDQAQAGQLYKFNIKQSTGREIMKIDPFAVCFEQRPGVAARIIDFPNRKWKDGLWRGRQKREHHFNRPLNIYEVHAGSWRFHEDGTPYDFSDLTRELIPYLKKMHYSHVEFMPLMEHPLPASWGYQIIGFYALCSSYGTPEQFQEFVESCHQANIGVIVDWVPGHFNINDDALAYYDGTATFEYEDADRAKNIGWGALNFDLGKPQVQSFLISSALFWLNAYHVDGIRADAISSIIYLDYDFGPWKPNKYGDTRNLEGYDFLHKATKAIKLVLYPVKVTLKKIKISLYGLIAEVLRGEVVSFAGNLDCVEVFNTLLNQIFQFCQGLRMWMMRHPYVLKIAPIVLNYCVISRSASAQRDCAYYCCWLNSY